MRRDSLLPKGALVALALGVLLLLQARPATAFGVGWEGSAGPEHTTWHAYNRVFDGWVAGPVVVSQDEDRGPWVQNLLRPLSFKGLDDSFNLLEIVRVGSTGWTGGWQEEIRTSGWAWDWGKMYSFAGGNLSLLDAGDVSTNGKTITFDFASIGAGTWLWIWKGLDWNGDGKPVSLQTASSFVPIPGAAWMLGAGLIGLVALRRRAAAR